MSNHATIQDYLSTHFKEAQARNPGYSLRAYARKLGVTPGTLSLVMLGKRAVSEKMATLIADKLSLDPYERSQVLGKFLEAKRLRAPSTGYLKLNEDQYTIVSEWEYFAVLNLMKTTTFKSDSVWIADRLGLSRQKVDEILERLLRLELIAHDENGKLMRQKSKYRTPDDVVSAALKESHHQTLELARESLSRDGVEERDFSALTLAFNPERMKEAKALVRKFQDDFNDIMHDGTELTEVYRLAVQLFPLSKLPRNNQ